jgi:glutamine synthetase
VANPYLALGVLVRAGLEGLRRELPMPEPTECDVDRLGDDEYKRRGIVRLPQSLGEALDALEADPVARTWFPARLHDAYLRYKRAEIALMEELTPAEQCERYSAVY